jgi:hypothetical protein
MNQLQPSWAKGYPVAPPGVGRPQLVTYPQSPFSGPACCCDVATCTRHSRNPPARRDYGLSGRRFVAFGESKSHKHFQLELDIKNEPRGPCPGHSRGRATIVRT